MKSIRLERFLEQNSSCNHIKNQAIMHQRIRGKGVTNIQQRREEATPCDEMPCCLFEFKKKLHEVSSSPAGYALRPALPHRRPTAALFVHTY
jgi:hypothetical protein